jgi:ribonucleoside-diphosphate reductase alpha chain
MSTELPRGLSEPAFDPNAMRVLKERYFAKKPDGSVETPVEFLWRVASAIAVSERPYAERAGRDADAVVDRVAHAFYEMLARRDFMPNTPCLVNAGRPLSMLSACFVLPVPDSIEGIFDNLKAMALIQKSGGGCVSADSRVWTTFCGLEPIEVLFNRATGDGRPGIASGNGIAYDVSDLGIRTLAMDPQHGQTGMRNVSHIWKFEVPAKDQVVVRTREGAEVQTSAWHPFMVVRGDRLTEVRADELAPADIILGPDRPDATWPWSDYVNVAGLTIDEKIGWLIGFTLGDGSFGYVPSLRQERLRWFSGTTDVLENVRTILAEHGINVGISKDPRGETRYVSTLKQSFVAAMLAACGFAQRGPKDARIRIPEHITKSPLSVVRAFLAGLLDSDGTVDLDGSPAYATVSREMAHDLSALLGLLGYRSRLRRREPQGRGKQAVFNVLLCPLPQVADLALDLAPYLSNDLRRTRLTSDCTIETALTLPFRFWRDKLAAHGHVQERFTKPAGPLADILSRWSCNAAGKTRRSDLLVIADALDANDRETAAFLRAVAKRGQEIASVEPAPTPMPYYDLTVEDWNTYAAGRTGMAMIHNTGFAFSDLRGHGSLVESTGKDASGPVSFMKVFNAATDSIKQGGVRRGANMGVLRVDHPDVFEFMHCKKELDAENRALWNRMSDTGRYTDEHLAHLKQELLQTQMNNFNISIGVTDTFMRAVEADGDFDLIDPRTKSVVRTVKAREIWDGIIEGAWQNGEPGVLFLDHPDANPLPGLGPIEATNPCVTADAWVTTTGGPQLVRDLIGKPFAAFVDGKAYPSTSDGFFFSGIKQVLRISTDRGFEVKVTGNHKIMLDVGGERRWMEASEIDIGSEIVLHNHEKIRWKGRGTKSEGWLLGNLLGDGHSHTVGRAHLQYWGNDAQRAVADALVKIRESTPARSDMRGTTVLERDMGSISSVALAELAEQFGMTHGSKRITDKIEATSSDFTSGFLQGWFDADGSVQGDLEKGLSVRLSSSCLPDLQRGQRMLARLGIVSTIYQDRRIAGERFLPDGKRGNALYTYSSQHELVVACDSIDRFAQAVNFSVPDKADKLAMLTANRKCSYRTKYAARVTSIEVLAAEPVYDCTVFDVHAFDANGVYVSNCGEQFLHGGDSCNLGSINVGHFFESSKNDVDWDRLAAAVHLSIRFLDNVIDANVYPLDSIAEMVTNNRRVGLGIMGFADLLIQLRIAYGSPEAIALAEKLMQFMQLRAEDTSEILARERGEFPNKHLSKWANDPRPRRNAALLSIAPTGTISMIAGCSFGCEPYFGIAYTKHVMKDAEGRPQHLYYVLPLFEEIAKDEGFFSDALLAKVEENRGSLKGIPEVPELWQRVFTVAADVTVDQHIDMLAAFQKHTCNAVSKTVNAPNDDTRENVARSIFRAYESGCKGFTYYRDGSRTEQVVTFSKDADISGVNRDADGKQPETAVTAAEAIVKEATAADPLEALLARAKTLLGDR